MTISTILTPVAFAAALALTAMPADAGQHRGGGGHSGGSHGAAVSRGGGSRGGVSRGVTASRGIARARSAPVFRSGVGIRGGVAIRDGVGIRRGIVVSGGRFAPRIVGSRGFIVGRSAFYRPYYSFRPRISLGFGLWVGYPVPYPYYYDYPYGYAYPYPVDPYAYGYAAPSYGYPAPAYAAPNQPSGYPPNDPSSGYPAYGSAGQGNSQAQQPAPSVGVQRGDEQSAPGGVSFDITPNTAAVFVDGTYVGTVATFGPTSQPLGLIAGRHHIEIRAAGYRTMTFEADVTPGQVIPYQGTLQRN
jgi:hypothetical protein